MAVQKTSATAAVTVYREKNQNYPVSDRAMDEDEREMRFHCVDLSDDESECSDSEVDEGEKQGGLLAGAVLVIASCGVLLASVNESLCSRQGNDGPRFEAVAETMVDTKSPSVSI